MVSLHYMVDRLLWPLCWVHGSSFAYLSPPLIPFLWQLSTLYTISSLFYSEQVLRAWYQSFSEVIRLFICIQDASAEKGIPGEEGDLLQEQAIMTRKRESLME